MPEYEFILDKTEVSKLIESILNTRARFIPFLCYETPKPKILKSLEEVSNIANSKSLAGPIFIIWDDVSVYPLEFVDIIKEDKKYYFLNQRHGGPYMELYLSNKIISKNTDNGIRSGAISYYKSFYIGENYSVIGIPEKIKIIFKELSKFIRSISIKMKTEKANRIYWIGKGVVDAIHRGDTTWEAISEITGSPMKGTSRVDRGLLNRRFLFML